MRPPPSFSAPPSASRILVTTAIAAALIVSFVVMTLVASIPPSHALMLEAALLWIGWGVRKRLKRSRQED